MFDIEIHLQGSEKFSEFSPDDLQELGFAIEDIVGCSLLQVLDTLTIVRVTVRYIPTGSVSVSLSIQNT